MTTEIKTIALEMLKNQKSILQMSEDDQTDRICNALEFAKLFLDVANNYDDVE